VRYLVDSDWLIDAFLGIPTAVDLLARLRGEGLAVSIISHGELFEGALGAPDPAAELARFRRFLARLAMLPLDEATMESFARIRASCAAEANSFPTSIS
jgi:predicted nucleic acid-binding protein